MFLYLQQDLRICGFSEKGAESQKPELKEDDKMKRHDNRIPKQ